MSKQTFIIFLTCASLLSQPLVSNENKLNPTKNLIKEWVEAEKIKSKEIEEGNLKLEILKQTNAVLSKELNLLKENLESQKSQLSQSDKEREIWVKKENTLSQRRDSIQKSLQQLSPKLLNMHDRLPPMLAANLKSDFNKLKEHQNSNKLNLGEQAQLIVSLLIAIQDFDKRIHLGYEVLKNNNNENVEVKVLYIGLSTAYYCSNDLELSGIGRAASQKWTWTSKPELADTIQQAFKIYESEIEDAKFLPLPVGDAS